MNFREINSGPQQVGKWRYICSSEWKEQPPRGGADKNRLTFTCQPQVGQVEGTVARPCPPRDAGICSSARHSQPRSLAQAVGTVYGMCRCGCACAGQCPGAAPVMGSPAEAGTCARHTQASMPGRWDSQTWVPGLWCAQGCLCMDVGSKVAGRDVGTCGMGRG